MSITLLHGDCVAALETIDRKDSVIVTDPPFNIGYRYNSYHDRMDEAAYYRWLATIIGDNPAVIVHYPENLYRLAIELGKAPERVASWVYPSNTAKQHRDIAFFGVEPDFSKVRQPYKNPTDKRVKRLIESGSKGAKLYDWWEINQVKNVQKKQLNHPCVMPVEVMKRIIGLLPDHLTVIDPFMGSGTTGVACAQLQRNFIGIELDAQYFDISKQRIQKEEDDD